MDKETPVRSRADLALVDAAVARLTRVNLQSPILVSVRQTLHIAVEVASSSSVLLLLQRRRRWLFTKVRLVHSSESLIGRVRVAGDR